MNTNGWAAVIVGTLAVVFFGCYYLAERDNSAVPDQNTASTTTVASYLNGGEEPASQPAATQNSSTEDLTTSSTDVDNYIYAIITVLNDLYQSTQEVSNVQTQYPGLSQQEQILTASLNVSNDLSNAASTLQPYTSDSDKAISSTATLIYADILIIQRDNNTVYQDLQSATPETFNPQQDDNDLAQLASAQSSLQNDLFQNQVLFAILKGIIEVPQNGTPTGPIDFAISADQRQDLENQIQETFGSELDNYDSSTYLLAVKLIAVELSFTTYEQQSSYKLQ